MILPRMSLILCLLLGLAVLPTIRGDEPEKKSERQVELEKSLRFLEKEIEKARGLAFKKPVVARIIPRPKDVAPGLQGYYSTKDKALTVYDDIKGNYEKGVLIHEMVHALQDQHFGLDKLHQSAFSSDDELAHAALIEGDATFTMIKVLEKDQPRAARMLDTPLEKANNLQNAFLYAQGARYVRAIQAKGGWPAVNARYRFPPSSTASILHPEERITPIDQGPGRSVGEFGLLQMLASSAATRTESVAAVAGWRGDRIIDLEGGRLHVTVFATPEQAARFQAALVKFRSARHPDSKPRTVQPGQVHWQTDKGQFLAVLLRGSRVLDLDGKGEASVKQAIERVEGPPPLTIFARKDGKTLTFGEFVDRLMEADLICVGESHDSELQHRIQLQILRAVYARDDRLGLGMEMFQRPFQKHIDRYLAGATNEPTFLEDTEYVSRWGYDWSLYQPLVEFCRRNRIPLAALNAPRELTQKISKGGVAGLEGADKKSVEGIDFHVKAHRDYWYERLAKMHGDTKPPEERKEKSYQVMTVWDGYMADSAARFVKERNLRRLIILAGSGHIDRGFGIPDRAARQMEGQAATVHLRVGGDLEKLRADAPADFVVIIR
jgi:uncharacterized iron-regulated protein